ncbi:MAG: sensor histidine kinase, partial [Solirubrobacteraceae bacterium]
AGGNGIAVTIEDDGAGFEPGPAATRAQSDGHLGLLGMRERVRMLGGRFTVQSRPGGPTLVSALLPPWPKD